MSSRKYLSGAQKRKLSEEKKEKREEQLKKIPKINTLFSVPGPSTSRSESESEEQEICESLDKSIGEISGETASLNLSIDDDGNSEDQFSNVSATSFACEIEQFSQTPFRFSTDVALWNIDADLLALQRYWARLGEYLYLALFLISLHFT